MSKIQIFRSAGLVLLIAFLSSSTSKQSAFAVSPSYSLVGSLNWRGTDFLEAKQEYVYCVTPFGVEVWNFSSQLHPNIVSRLYLEDRATRLAVNDGFLAVAGNSGKLVIINIGSQQQLTIAGEVSFEGNLIDLATEGNRVLVLATESLQIFEVSSSLIPAFAGLYYVPEGKALTVENDRAYVATTFDFGSIHVLDITDTSAPNLIGKILGLTTIKDIEVRNDTLFASGTLSDLEIWDMTVANSARSIASINFPSSTVELSLSGNYVALGYEYHTLRIIDISHPESPVSRAIVNYTGARRCLSTSGSLAYVVDDRRFRILDFTAPASPQWTFDSVTPFSPHYGGTGGLAAAGGELYVACGTAGVSSYTGWRTNNAVESDKWITPSCASGTCGAASVCATDNLVFTMFGGENQAYLNVVDRKTGQFVGEYQSPWYSSRMRVVHGDTLLMSTLGSGIIVADFSIPSNPAIINTLSSSGMVLDIDTNGNSVVKKGWDSNAQIWNFSDWESPRLLSTYSGFTPWCFWENPPGPGGMTYVCNDVGPYSASVEGNLVAAITLTDGLTILDISDPINPSMLSRVHSNCSRVELRNSIAFVVRSSTIDIYDLSTPTNPLLTNSIDCRAAIADFIFVEEFLAVSTSAGVLVFHQDQATDVTSPDSRLPQAFTLSQNFPNPFNANTVIDYSVDRHSQILIEVFNILGQKVRTLVNSSMPPGRYRVEWDGNDQSGNTVSSGVYLYRIKSNESEQTRKMLLLK